MREWLKATGGPFGVVLLGVGLLFAFWPLGTALIVLGVLVYLNAAPWFPWRVVREAKLELGITDVNFTYGKSGYGQIQVNAWVRNLGGPTILHSWQLAFEVAPGKVERSTLIYDWRHEGCLAHLQSLTEATRREPLGEGLEKGLVCFVLPDGLTLEMVEQAQATGVVGLAVSDRSARRWSVRQELAELPR